MRKELPDISRPRPRFNFRCKKKSLNFQSVTQSCVSLKAKTAQNLNIERLNSVEAWHTYYYDFISYTKIVGIAS